VRTCEEELSELVKKIIYVIKMSSYSPRRKPRVGIAELVRQDNRTKFLVYAYDHTGQHDPFLNRLFHAIPPSGASRGFIRNIISEQGGGMYALSGNVVTVNMGSAKKRIFGARRSRSRRGRRRRS
jgi:hypothetical protein